MKPVLAPRSKLQLRADHAFLQLEEAITELDRRRRRALSLSQWMIPVVVVIASGLLVRRMLRHRGDHRLSVVGGPAARPVETVGALLLTAALRAWAQRAARSNPIDRQWGPGRPS
jgi:hypothetical protein